MVYKTLQMRFDRDEAAQVSKIVNMDVAPCILTRLETESMPKLYGTSRDFGSLNTSLVECSSAPAVYQGDHKQSGADMGRLRNKVIFNDAHWIAPNDLSDLIVVLITIGVLT
ncbi:MAG: hypothetical protein Q9208_003841 [Pyrenodesmia sp. 3 TL-2023]